MGKKRHTQKQKEAAIARLTLGESPTKIAKDLNIPRPTVAYWKVNLLKVKKQDGTLGYHFEKQKNLVDKAWKGAEIAVVKIIKALKTVELKTSKDIKDITSVLGTLLDRIDKATPRPQIEAGATRPLIDLTGASKKELEMIIAKVTLKDKTPQLEEGEVIEGESREISQEEEKDGN